jgi:hypothetical protein
MVKSTLGVRIVGTIIFEGSPPFGLAGVQAASADAAAEGVEMILDVKQPDIFPLPVQVRVSLTQKAAVALATDLRLAALKVERNALTRGV